MWDGAIMNIIRKNQKSFIFQKEQPITVYRLE